MSDDDIDDHNDDYDSYDEEINNKAREVAYSLQKCLDNLILAKQSLHEIEKVVSDSLDLELIPEMINLIISYAKSNIMIDIVRLEKKSTLLMEELIEISSYPGMKYMKNILSFLYKNKYKEYITLYESIKLNIYDI